jgi:exopolyphosphatase / guanosine-5'-triphosphate,3'-diphosphate pyrophosphatase
VRRACIDVGSNTTRLLVAECDGEQLREIHQERAFTRIGRALGRDGAITDEKIDEVVEVVAGQLTKAGELGAGEVQAVATAAIRHAANGAALVRAIREHCGLEVKVLSGEEEARLAFIGAARTLGHVPGGALGVVDVGGGSSELVVGTFPDNVSWSTSFRVGSGDLTEGWLRSDPPSALELRQARAHVAAALKVLNAESFTRSLRLLTSSRASEIARRFALDIERVRLLAAGLVILQAASELFGASLQIGRGGVREGVLLEASA